jgi:flagellar hook-length control protein FliK
MTVSVKQAWAALLPDRGKADARRQNGKGDETAFSEAVKFGAPGKQARRSTADAAGELHRPGWNVEINLPDQAVGEPHAAGANNARYPWQRPVGLPDIVADHRDADGREDPKAAAPRAAPDERTETASETMPIAFRPPLPPSSLLGGFDRPETGAASDGDLTSSTAPASLQTGTASPPPSAPVKAGATLAKTAVVAPPAVAAAEITVAPLTAAYGPKITGKEVEPRPLPASLGELAMKPPAGAQSGAVSTNEITKPVVAESAARPDGAAPSTIIARDWSREKKVPDVPGQAAPVTVLARQDAPAPATPLPGLTAAPLLTAIAADGSWRELAAVDLRALPAQNAVAPAHSLKVQLHPAELGMVTASLRFAGEQLTVELQVESVEAQQRLSADTDTIVRSLRALGLEVDRVTIQQSSVAHASNARAETNAGHNGQPAPDRQSFSAANSGGGNGQAGGQHSGRNPSNGAQASQNTARGSADRAGGGLYI